MPYQTQPNVALNQGWKQLATGATEVTIQVFEGGPAIIAVGTLPDAASEAGFRVTRDLQLTGLTTETVWGRVSTGFATVAVLKL